MVKDLLKEEWKKHKASKNKEEEPKKKLTKTAIKVLQEKAGLTDKDYKINMMLSQEKKPYQCMAIGLHKNHYYFGSILDYGLKKVPVIITDEGKIFWLWREKQGKEWIIDDEIRNKFGLNYRFELFSDCVDNLWSNKSIKQFTDGKSKEQSFKELFERIKNKNEELMYHSDKRVHSYISCDIISNYFYTLFDAKGRTYFQADFGSGKSRQSLIYQKLSFNSLFASNISPASFERVIESTGGTIIVDNFDNIADDLKPQILQVIEVYYKKGGKNIKSAGQGFEKNKPIAFNGFSPLVINNIVGLPEVTTSRCNKIQMLKTDDKNIADVKINEKDKFWSETKDDLHILALQKWKEVLECYENIEVKEFAGRGLEKTEAILTIAKLVGEKVYSDILSFLIEINQQQSIKDVQDNWEFILFDFLNKVVEDGVKDMKVQEITACVSDRIIQNEKTAKTDKLKYSHYCGKILSGIPIFRKKTIGGWVYYEIDRKNLTKIIKLKGYDKYLVLPHPTSPNTTNTTNNTLQQGKREGEVSEVGEVKGVKRVAQTTIFKGENE